MPSAAAGAGHHQMPGGINLKPTFIPQLTQHAGHGHPCGAEGAGDLLMGQAKVEPLPGLTGFAEVLGEQFQEAPDPFFNAPQPQQGQERLRLAVACLLYTSPSPRD